jgi:sugar lactone lactonase YvrE
VPDSLPSLSGVPPTPLPVPAAIPSRITPPAVLEPVDHATLSPAAGSLPAAPTTHPGNAPQAASPGAAPDIDLGKVFEKRPNGPYPPQEVADWTYEARDSHSIDDVVHASGGRVFLTAHSFDTGTSKGPRGYTTAFDAQGKQTWEYRPDPARGEDGQNVHSTLFLPDGSSFVLTRSEEIWDPSFLVALGPDGKEKWRFATDSRQHVDSVRPGPAGRVYARVADKVHCFDSSGGSLWSTDLPIRADEFFHVITPDGTQLFVDDNFTSGFGSSIFYAIDPNGKGSDRYLPDITTFPVEMGQRLVYGGQEGKVHGIDLGSFEGWEVQTDSTRGFKTPFEGRDGNLYIEGRFDDTLYAISPQGQKLWQAPVSDARSPGLDGERFEVDTDGSAYYLKADESGLQQIQPDGRAGRLIKIPEGVDGFKPGGDGRMYVWSSAEASILTYDLKTGARLNVLPLEMEFPQQFNLIDVLPGGAVVLKSMDHIYRIRADRNPSLEKQIDELESGAMDAKPGTPPGIEKQDEYVVIGGVRVPVRKKSVETARG